MSFTYQRPLNFLSTVAVVLCFITWWATRSGSRPKATVFVGQTNRLASARAVAAPMVDAFRRMGPIQSNAIQRWLDSGTNVALFRVRNRGTSAIELFPTCRFFHKDDSRTVDYLPMLSAPTASGILLLPGGMTTVEVPSLPQSRPWKAQFVYHKLGAFSLFRFLRIPGGEPGHALETDWIEP